MSGTIDYLSSMTPDEIVVQAKSIEGYLKGNKPYNTTQQVGSNSN